MGRSTEDEIFFSVFMGPDRYERARKVRCEEELVGIRPRQLRIDLRDVIASLS